MRTLGLDDPQWGTGAAFGDLDRDGVSDLVVVNYVDFRVEETPGPGEEPFCLFRGLPVMCGPNGLTPAPAVLYRGLPDGSFARVDGQAIGAERYFGLGVVFGDLDGDGDLDVYVANDQTPNNFYRNDTGAGGFEFTDVGLSAGVAYNEDGRAQAGMGVDLGDYDNDGRLDIVVTNFSQDYNTIYRAVGGGWFLDESFAAGVAEPSYPYLGWGTGFRDLDRDGWLDLVVLNGHVYPEVEGGITESDYAQRGLVFRNRTDGAFEEIAPTALGVPRVYRGAAFADYDDDGDIDLLATVMNGSPALFRNDTETAAAWAGFRLVGRESPAGRRRNPARPHRRRRRPGAGGAVGGELSGVQRSPGLLRPWVGSWPLSGAGALALGLRAGSRGRARPVPAGGGTPGLPKPRAQPAAGGRRDGPHGPGWLRRARCCPRGSDKTARGPAGRCAG